MDVRTGELPSSAYDLVSCRALLHQIAGYAPAVLAQMAAALKPGGWLLIQEPDFHLAPTTEPDVWAATWKALIEWGHTNGIDWLMGRKLPGMVSKLVSGNHRPRPTCRTFAAGIAGPCIPDVFR